MYINFFFGRTGRSRTKKVYVHKLFGRWEGRGGGGGSRRVGGDKPISTSALWRVSVFDSLVRGPSDPGWILGVWKGGPGTEDPSGAPENLAGPPGNFLGRPAKTHIYRTQELQIGPQNPKPAVDFAE